MIPVNNNNKEVGDPYWAFSFKGSRKRVGSSALSWNYGGAARSAPVFSRALIFASKGRASMGCTPSKDEQPAKLKVFSCIYSAKVSCLLCYQRFGAVYDSVCSFRGQITITEQPKLNLDPKDFISRKLKGETVVKKPGWVSRSSGAPLCAPPPCVSHITLLSPVCHRSIDGQSYIIEECEALAPLAAGSLTKPICLLRW